VTLPAMMRRGDLAAMQGRAMRARRHRPETARLTRIGLWLPLTPLFWALSPVAFLLAPLLAVAPPLRGMNPYAAVVGLGHVLTSMGGTVVDVDTHDARIRIRIF